MHTCCILMSFVENHRSKKLKGQIRKNCDVRIEIVAYTSILSENFYL